MIPVPPAIVETCLVATPKPVFHRVDRRHLRSQQVAQHCNERLVGRRHRIVAEPSRAHPGEALAFAGHRDPGPFTADIKRHQQVELG